MFLMICLNKLLLTSFLQLDIYSLSRKWKELVDKARAKQLQPHEYNSGIFLPHTQSEYVAHCCVSFLMF
jgi:pyruvate dehydrogenase E2 component (dihydrolipoamide acetyltransferase)